MTKRLRRPFTTELKKQMVQLHGSGNSKTDMIRQYELTPSTLDKWITQANNSGSFKEKDNRTMESSGAYQITQRK